MRKRQLLDFKVFSPLEDTDRSVLFQIVRARVCVCQKMKFLNKTKTARKITKK